MENVPMDSNGNSVFSPDSCSSLFSATSEYFDEVTKIFLKGLFSQRSENYSKYLNLFEKKLWKKTKLFVRKESPLINEIKDELENKFGCDIDEVDMKDSESASTITRWIDEHLGDFNCDFFATPNMNNILKMNFEWDSSIKVETSTKKFHINNDSFDTDFIDINGTFGYADSTDLDAKIVEIPLSSENLKVLLIVPNNRKGLQDLEIKLSRSYLDNILLSKIQQREMNVSMPKFKLKQEHNLKDLLHKVHHYEYPYKFGRTDVYRLSAMKSVTSIEVSE